MRLKIIRFSPAPCPTSLRRLRLLSTRHFKSELARTVALRFCRNIGAYSPNISPRPRLATCWPSINTSAIPSRMINPSSPGIPSRRISHFDSKVRILDSSRIDSTSHTPPFLKTGDADKNPSMLLRSMTTVGAINFRSPKAEKYAKSTIFPRQFQKIFQKHDSLPIADNLHFFTDKMTVGINENFVAKVL